METERITLSQRERDRLKVLHEVQQRQLTQVEAAARLKVSDRQVRRMLLRIREHGDAALVQGLRGRPSNRKLAARFAEKVLTRVGQRYADFGPTLAAGHLAKDGFPASRETLRTWMSKAAFWHPRCQRVKKFHVWRERRALILLDLQVTICRGFRNPLAYCSDTEGGTPFDRLFVSQGDHRDAQFSVHCCHHQE
jgi:transposase